MFSFLVPSAPPTDLSAITPNATTLDITWQPPGLAHQNGIIRGYVLTVFSIEGGTSQQLNSNESHLVIYNLHPFYTYSFHIAAVTVGPGPFSEIFSIQMPPTGKLAIYKYTYLSFFFSTMLILSFFFSSSH